MACIEEIILISVEVRVALDILEATLVRHHHDVKVAAHCDSGLEGWDRSELAEAIHKSDEAYSEHHGQHAHEELLLPLA